LPEMQPYLFWPHMAEDKLSGASSKVLIPFMGLHPQDLVSSNEPHLLMPL
jgi:hypothetical protein